MSTVYKELSKLCNVCVIIKIGKRFEDTSKTYTNDQLACEKRFNIVSNHIKKTKVTMRHSYASTRIDQTPPSLSRDVELLGLWDTATLLLGTYPRETKTRQLKTWT